MIGLQELFLTGGISLSSVIAAYVAIKSKISKMEVDIEYIKKELEEEKKLTRESYLSINTKLDILITNMNQMKIEQSIQKSKQDEINKRNT